MLVLIGQKKALGIAVRNDRSIVFSWHPDGIWTQTHGTLCLFNGLSAAQFIRYATLLTDRTFAARRTGTQHASSATPTNNAPTTINVVGSLGAPQTEKSLAHATKLSPAPLRRVRRSQSIEIPRRRSGSECPVVQHQPRYESPAPVAARPPKAKVRRKFRPASARSQQPKIRSTAASQKCATPASHRESVPKPLT